METHLLQQSTIIYVNPRSGQHKNHVDSESESRFRDDPNNQHGYTAERAISQGHF